MLLIRDAKDAVYERDGYDYDGYKLRVEFPRGRERGPGGVFKSGSSHSRPAPARRSSYRIKVTGNNRKKLMKFFLNKIFIFQVYHHLVHGRI